MGKNENLFYFFILRVTFPVWKISYGGGIPQTAENALQKDKRYFFILIFFSEIFFFIFLLLFSHFFKNRFGATLA